MSISDQDAPVHKAVRTVVRQPVFFASTDTLTATLGVWNRGKPRATYGTVDGGATLYFQNLN